MLLAVLKFVECLRNMKTGRTTVHITCACRSHRSAPSARSRWVPGLRWSSTTLSSILSTASKGKSCFAKRMRRTGRVGFEMERGPIALSQMQRPRLRHRRSTPLFFFENFDFDLDGLSPGHHKSGCLMMDRNPNQDRTGCLL